VGLIPAASSNDFADATTAATAIAVFAAAAIGLSIAIQFLGISRCFRVLPG